MNSSKTLTLALFIPALLLLPGCSLFSSPESAEADNAGIFTVSRDTSDLNVSEHTPDSLANYQLGRNYAAAGRYELAREHYLIALAAAGSPAMQEALAKELSSIDMMIKSLR